MVKNPPAKQKTRVQSLGWEDPVNREMANHSNIFAYEIPWTEEPGRDQIRVGHDFEIKPPPPPIKILLP